MIYDQSLSFDSHIRTMVHSLKKQSQIYVWCVKKWKGDAFISSRLDYCNSLFTYLKSYKSSLPYLQTIQNAVERPLTQSNRWSYIIPILNSALASCSNIFYLNILLVTYRVLHSYVPQYVIDLLRPHTTRQALIFSTQGFLSGPRTCFKTRRDCAFQSADPKPWNSLPISLRSLDSLWKHINHLFRQAFR